MNCPRHGKFLHAAGLTGPIAPIDSVDGRPRHALAFHAAIFDFDETLFDLEHVHKQAEEILCRRYGKDWRDLPDDLQNASGRRLVDVLDEIRVRLDIPRPLRELLAERQAIFLHLLEEVGAEPLPGVERLVRNLHRRGLRLAVCSSGERDYIEFALERSGLRAAFEVFVTGQEVRRPKPDPQAYLLTAERLERTPEDCLAFDDSEIGVTAARRAGCFTVGVHNPNLRSRQNLSLAHMQVTDLAQLDIDELIARGRARV